MVTEPSLWGSMSPGFKPFLRAEPGGRRASGGNQALKPQVLHPTSCDGFLAAAAEEGERGVRRWRKGSSRLGSPRYGLFMQLCRAGRVARLPFPPCHAGWLHLASCRGPRCCRFPLAGFEARPGLLGQLPGGRPPCLAPLALPASVPQLDEAQLRPLHPLLSVGTTCVCDGPSPG